MLSKVVSGTTIGLEGTLIDVEVDVASMGFPSFTIVGLPTKTVDEAKDRVRTAVVNTGFEMPDSRITVNLAPADIPKEGSCFDLPIAVGILTSSGMIDKKSIESSLFIGELSLLGEVRKVPGVISVAAAAASFAIQNIFVPRSNAREAALIESVNVYPVANLTDLVLHLNDQKKIEPVPATDIEVFRQESYQFDFSEVKGQEYAKRAFEIAAAGFHNILLKGVPGAGKTMLSRAFASILPPMSKDEILEVSKIHSVAGLLREEKFFLERPFRSPHHTTSRIGLIGGSSKPAPGEVSLAHRGVLFLDEFPEFPRSVLEALRQPLEDGIVSISRAAGSLTFPSRFLLVAACNPCPCGYLGHPKKSCKCMPGSVLRYRKKLSGPLLDRIDIHVDVAPVDEEKLVDKNSSAESSQEIRARVIAARARQTSRFKGRSFSSNSEMKPRDIKNLCKVSEDATDLLKQAISKLSLSARSYFKIIKLAQTIADLDSADSISIKYIAEALQYRAKED